MTLYFMFTCKQSIFIHFAIFEVIFVTIRHAALIMVEMSYKDKIQIWTLRGLCFGVWMQNYWKKVSFTVTQ